MIRSFLAALASALLFCAASAGAEPTIVLNQSAGDIVFSKDGSKLYTSVGGDIVGIDVASGQELSRWKVGTSLGGIDVSTDGKYLLAAETTKLNYVAGDYWWSDKTTIGVHRVDLSTGSVFTMPFDVTGAEGPSYDVAATASGKVLVTSTGVFRSGLNPLHILSYDGESYNVSNAKSKPTSVRQDSALTSSEDDTIVLLGVADISDAGLYVFDANTKLVAKHGWYTDGVYGFNRGTQAISSAGHLIAQSLYNTMPIYNDRLKYKFNLYSIFPELAYNTTGVTFSADGSTLFVMTLDEIWAINTNNWLLETRYKAPGALLGLDDAKGWSAGLTASADGRSLAILGHASVMLLNLRGGSSTVPEPASWMLLILGFGTIGVRLRIRCKNSTCAGIAHYS